MTKIVAVSDLHLDWVTHGVSRLEDVVSALDLAVDRAIEERAAAFLFLGDMCDPDSGSRAFRCLEEMIRIVVRLANAGIQFVAIAGNHDVVEDGAGTTTLAPLSSLGLDGVWICENPGICYLRRADMNLGGLRIGVLPFTASSHSYDPIEVVARWPADLSLVISHLSVPGIVPGEETIDMPRGRDVILPVAAIRERCPEAKILQGHYHRRQVTRDGVTVVGSLARLTFNEEGNRPGFLVVDV